MKILIVSQYFRPENFRVNELAEGLIKLGHKVTVLTGYPNYPKGDIYLDFKKNKKKFHKYKGVEIIRVPILPRKKNKFNLILNYLSFSLNSIFIGYLKLRKKNFDIVFTFQLSPVTVGITSAFFSTIKKCPHIFWVLDLWPDTLEALDILKKKWQLNYFKILINWIYKKCDLILAQSNMMLEEIKKYPSVKNNAFYFPSWGDSNLFLNANKAAKEIEKNNKFTIIFAGNIGEAQDFPNLLKAVKRLSLKKIKTFRIILIGEGSKKEWIKNEIKELKIEDYFEFHKSYPLKRMPEFFLHADALYVSLLNKKVFNITIPGKIQFYLSSGKPIIGMICGEAAEIIKKSRSGLVCDSGDDERLSEIINEIINYDKKYLIEMGLNGKNYAEKEFSKNLLINKLNKIFIKAINNEKIIE